MPLTQKGNEILSNMEKEYGTKKGEEVFYASRNKGTIAGVDGDTPDPVVEIEGKGPTEVTDAVQAALDTMAQQINSLGEKAAEIVKRVDARGNTDNDKKIAELTRRLEELESKPFTPELDKEHQKLMRERAALGWTPAWLSRGLRS